MSLPVLSWDDVTNEFVSISIELKDEYLNNGMKNFMRKLSMLCDEINKITGKRILRKKIKEVFDWFDFCERNIRKELESKGKLIQGKYSFTPFQREICKKEINFLVRIRGIIYRKRTQFTQLGEMV